MSTITTVIFILGLGGMTTHSHPTPQVDLTSSYESAIFYPPTPNAAAATHVKVVADVAALQSPVHSSNTVQVGVPDLEVLLKIANGSLPHPPATSATLTLTLHNGEETVISFKRTMAIGAQANTTDSKKSQTNTVPVTAADGKETKIENKTVPKIVEAANSRSKRSFDFWHWSGIDGLWKPEPYVPDDPFFPAIFCAEIRFLFLLPSTEYCIKKTRRAFGDIGVDLLTGQ